MPDLSDMSVEQRLDLLEMFGARMVSRLRRLEAMAEMNGLELPDEEWGEDAEQRRQLAREWLGWRDA